MAHHSKSNASLGDGIVIGVSVLGHINENCEDLRRNELSEDVDQVFELAWLKAMVESCHTSVEYSCEYIYL